MLVIILAGMSSLSSAKSLPRKNASAQKQSSKKKPTKPKSKTITKSNTSTDIKSVQNKIEKAKLEQEKNQQEQEKLRKKSSVIDVELSNTKTQITKTAQKIRENEAALSKFDKMIADMQKQEVDIQNQLKYTNQTSATVMMAFQNLALYQKGTQFLLDKSPLEMVRTSMLLATILPHLEKNAQDFQNNFDNLVKVREGIRGMRAETQKVSQVMSSEKNNLQKLMNNKTMEKQRLKERDKALSAENKRLVAQAKNFEELLKNLLAQAAREKARKAQALAASQGKKYTPRAPSVGQNKDSSFYKARGRMIMPAIGEVVEFFARNNKIGAKSKGIRIKTRDAAQVVSSYDGGVIFADYFKGYGNMVILDNGDGYNTLISGLDRLDVGAGQEVLAGEPLGQMGSPNDGVYVEIRSNGQPLDPMFFLKS